MKCNVAVSSVCTCGDHVGVLKVYALGYQITAETKRRGLETHITISLNVGLIIYFQRIYGLKRSNLHLLKNWEKRFS